MARVRRLPRMSCEALWTYDAIPSRRVLQALRKRTDPLQGHGSASSALDDTSPTSARGRQPADEGKQALAQPGEAALGARDAVQVDPVD